MRFGVSLLAVAQQPKGTDPSRQVEEVLTWARAARDLGFDYLTMGQHYLTSPYQMFQPIPLLARLIPETGQMRLVTTLIIPLHNPVDLAESLATLDVLSGGRIGISCALGYRDEEYRAFGVDPKRRVSRMTECVQCLVRLWTEEEVTFHGQHFTLERATVVLRPLQKPHPPQWIAANSDSAIIRAARMGLPWNINPHATLATIQRQVALYRQAAQEAGKDPTIPLPMGRELYCAPTAQQAWEEVGPYIYGKYQAYAQWGQDKALPGQETFRTRLDALAQDRFIIGSPDDCSRVLERYAELGIGSAHFRMHWPGMPLSQALRGMELFARRVMPRFR
ncbi:MAG: LLM class flavin-dependent oxidoreductase [Chloroflexota bacterium]|nr:LLM class flavin-dependent oxidoreductase [Chloroflexota bacterium]